MLSKIGLAIAAIGLLASAYFQFVVLEDTYEAQLAIEMMEREAAKQTAETGQLVEFYDMEGYHEAREIAHSDTNAAIGLLGIGALAFLICVGSLVRGNKKDKLAQVGAGLSLLPLILGILNGTHMFS